MRHRGMSGSIEDGATGAEVWVIELNELGPVLPEPDYPQVQPGFVVAVVVDDRSAVDLLDLNAGVVAEPQNVPTTVQGVRQVVKRNQTRRQGSQLPQRPILVLQKKTGAHQPGMVTAARHPKPFPNKAKSKGRDFTERDVNLSGSPVPKLGVI